MDQGSQLRQEQSVLLGRALLRLQDAVLMATTRARQRLMQGAVVFSIITLLLWVSAFLYGSFYYSFMPTPAFSTAVHYHYRSGCENHASFLCSYPMANISLMKKKKHVLTFGQAYQITLQLEMPESQVNQDLGMFMIQTSCFSQDGGKVHYSARPARQLLSASSSRFSMLRYRSDLLRLLGTVMFLPAFLTGVAEEKQVLDVLLFSEYIEDPYAPSVTAVIEILSSKVQIYSSQINIHAHYTGIRYLLFNFPLFSSVVGVTSNFVFLGFLFLLSYLRLLLKVGPKLLGTDGLVSEEEHNVNSNQQEEVPAASGATELLGPLQRSTTNMRRRGPPWYFGRNTAVRNEHTNGQTESS